MATTTTAARTTPVLLVLTLALLALAIILPGRIGAAAAPDGNGRLEIVMEDYRFSPDTIALPTGTTLELVFVNRDEVGHHVAIGRQVLEEDGRQVGYAEDLFAGATVRVDPSRARVGPSEQHPTFTILVEPGTTATVWVTLPEEQAGDWELGCFTAAGCHFRTGMVGEVTVG
jgi:plastocyanin